MEDVANAIERHKWQRDPGHNENLGFYKQHRFIGVVGSKSIHADLGDYREWHFPIVGYKDWATWANVEVYWGFDEHGKLIDIWVQSPGILGREAYWTSGKSSAVPIGPEIRADAR